MFKLNYDYFQRIFFPRLFWFYFFGIVLLLILPINNVEKLKNLDHVMVVKVRGDYFFHALTFLPWAFFGPSMKKKTGLWMIVGIIFAMGMEMLQYILPNRRFNINDLIANGFGVFLGSILMIFFMASLNRIQKIKFTVTKEHISQDL